MAKLLLGIEGNAANSNSIVLPLELPVNPTRRRPVYLPKPGHQSPAIKLGTYRASGLVQGRRLTGAIDRFRISHRPLWWPESSRLLRPELADNSQS